jgi:hypothetical protein
MTTLDTFGRFWGLVATSLAIALFHRFPEPLVAHDYSVEPAIGVEHELVLVQHTQLRRAHNGPILRS